MELPTQNIDGGVNKPVFIHIALLKADEAWTSIHSEHCDASSGLRL